MEYATTDRASEASAVGFAPAGTTEDGFVALALRPRLPSRIAARGRDQVLLVDVGRAMFGERLKRASRLAVTIAQQMDRRDRLTVLACDVECRALPGGWHAPGAAAAHDVDAFLAGVEADGASDLVGAVRAAAAVGGRDSGHDLRVVLLSDGAASAGYRSAARVAAEVTDALPDARAEVVAVPIGSDADVDTLGEIARGGGGAVVPYAPGQALDAAALDVLSATYGATLRDVEVTLPEGLHDVVPARVATIRAGSETLVAARLHGDRASGDVVLRGKVAGEPFEARWPIEVRATSDEGNAWAARTWAAHARRGRRPGDRRGAAHRVGLAVASLPRAEPVDVAARARERGDVPRLRHRARRARLRVDGRERDAADGDRRRRRASDDEKRRRRRRASTGSPGRARSRPLRSPPPTLAGPTTLGASSGFGGGGPRRRSPRRRPRPWPRRPRGRRPRRRCPSRG